MNTDLQDTNVNEESQENSADAGAPENEGAEQQGETQNAESSTDTAENSGNSENSSESEEITAPFLVARYNKKDVPLTEEQAKEFAQKGMHYEDKLDYLATIKGTTINEMLKKAIDDIDNAERSRLEEQFGDDTEMIEKCMKVFHDEQKTKYENAIADRKAAEDEKEQSRVAQIGEEFIALQKDFPELKSISDVPKEVVKDAGKMSLEHAYLKYLHKENKNKQEALAKQAKAEKQSTGSMQTNTDSDTGFESFARGVWG